MNAWITIRYSIGHLIVGDFALCSVYNIMFVRFSVCIIFHVIFQCVHRQINKSILHCF